ncbi:MAG: acyl-CoA thioesterase [Candidatus Tectimicrobiota bacterium]
MTAYTETFRGQVQLQEIDATEHFTVACYYEKFEAATWRFLRLMDVDPAAARTTAALTTYTTELRQRDIYRIETAVIASGPVPILGHKLFNAATGGLCTAMQQTLTGVTLAGPAVVWDGNVREERAVPGDEAGWVPSSLDIVRPEEADWSGRLSLRGYIRRFGTANGFVMSALGMTPEYMTEARVGLSTFEFQLTLHSLAKPGDVLDVESCLAHLGNSSLRFYHRMRNAETGAEVAGLSQFGVQLDLDARRPSRIPDHIRERHQALRESRWRS